MAGESSLSSCIPAGSPFQPSCRGGWAAGGALGHLRRGPAGRVGIKIAPEMNFNDVADDTPEETYRHLVEQIALPLFNPAACSTFQTTDIVRIFASLNRGIGDDCRIVRTAGWLLGPKLGTPSCACSRLSLFAWAWWWRPAA